MAEYISRVRGYEILQMKAEFFKDENDWMWFFYAKEIYMRKCKTNKGLSNVDAKKKAEKIKEDKARAKKQLIEELEEFNNPKGPKNTAIANMLNHMNSYYEELKVKEGIDDEFHNVDKNSIIHRIEDVIK